MSSGSKLSPLLSEYDLKLGCCLCAVREREITYSVRPVAHRCERTVLLCKAKADSRWRPVSGRPTFPVPRQYAVCWFFKEGSGCTQHGNRCTYARSTEEAAVWMFEKQHGLNHQFIRNAVAESERGPETPRGPDPPDQPLADLDLKAVCELCTTKLSQITFSLRPVPHTCRRDLLLAKGKASNQWRLISERPTGGHIGPNVLYKVCNYFVEVSGCTQHGLGGLGCTYAKSYEEAAVWNYLRESRKDKAELIRFVTESESVLCTPEGAAESILQQYRGEFIEFCKDCFQENPQRLTVKRWNDTCSADAAHRWSPVLFHHLSTGSTKHIYSQVRPVPREAPFKFCSHVRQGKPCWHRAGHCRAAQSEVEMSVWRAEQGGAPVRPHLLQLSQKHQPNQPNAARRVTMFCKVCLLELASPENFYKHCASLEHARLLTHDTTTRWRGRQPPHHQRAQFWLCDRPESCEYGNNCPKAHSEEELKEWMMRAEEEVEIRSSMEAQGLMSYNQRLLDEYRNSSNEVYIMSEHVDDVSISCDEELNAQCDNTNTTLTWNFRVETERELVHVALLKEEPGASFSLGDSSPAPCVYASGRQFPREDMTYSITVTFTSVHAGRYEQWLVLDFDMRPVLLKKLKVRVGQPPSDDTEQSSSDQRATVQSAERWHRGNRVIIPCSSRTEEQQEMLKQYKPPLVGLVHRSPHNKETPLTRDNYREKMHRFLYDEERAEDQVVSRLNVCGEVQVTDMLNGAPPSRGDLFCAVQIPCNLTVDSPEGRMLKRSIRSALIAPSSSSHPNSKVYEASVLHHKTSKNQIYLLLSKQCSSDLALKSSESYQMEVQFQLDRLSFCTMHKAIDLLSDTSRVVPDLSNCAVPVSKVSCELNSKQKSAVDFILGTCDGKKPVAPLLIYGPFGTGKTLTLATAARELCKHPHNKVLICTYTNSSADLYVRDHFHPFISRKNNSLKPVRIKANKHGNALAATDENTLRYCSLSEDKQHFLPPTKAILRDHNIIITTTSMAKHFHGLGLAEGFFTHILIDEASQMLECEALLALALAGPNTRIVLAGDHMQMGPQLFSVDEHRRSDYTILTRLFHYYQGQKCDAAQNSRIIFSDNYRSTTEIVEFVSTNFYVGKNDAIRATGNIPAPSNGHALKFHHVRGECLLDAGTMSWYNKQEVAEVVEAVKDVLKDWPSSWGPKRLNSVCILSEGSQVRQIRMALPRSLSEVNVETILNVQGKQFRAVIITAVQTRDSLQVSHLPGLPLFNDPRVLNTAMTRAQSQVIVVGDAAALCCFGKCSGIWKSFMDHCITNKNVVPQHYTKDFFEKDIMEIARFQKTEVVDEIETVNDAILQELRDEYEKSGTESSSDEDNVEELNPQRHRGNEDQTNLLDLCSKQPKMFERGKFFRQSYLAGYVVPFHGSNRRISIQGRKNTGKAFTGDEVVIQTQEPRVVGIIKSAKTVQEFLCFLEDEDHSKKKSDPTRPNIRRLMIPIKRSAPKICILIKKKERNFIPVWEQSEGYWTKTGRKHLKEVRDCVFVVQVIGWKEHCCYPLGKVIDILPKTGYSGDRLWLQKEEFGVSPTPPETDGLSLEEEDTTDRRDERKTITFTVDPAVAKDLDDAISIRDDGEYYELGIHISDVASFVEPGGTLDEIAGDRGCSFYGKGEEPTHMFPKEQSTELFSLLPDEDRRVVSLMFKVRKDTDKVEGKPMFQLSLINSNRKLSYEEAEDIISQRYRGPPSFCEVEDCVTVAYRFAKAQRKSRLPDWAYSQCDDERLPGRRKARVMIEEINVLFNRHASETLLHSPLTRRHTPLRCQAKPDDEKVEYLKEKLGELIPLSFHVRHKVDMDQHTPSIQHFPILTNMWEEILSAARADDMDKMVDLVAADDIHPLLQPVIEEFRRCSSKAVVIQSDSWNEVNISHYTLNLPSYTQASSPIRRYLDIVVQRLLHSVIRQSDVQYTSSQADWDRFEENIKKAKEYEQKTEQIVYAESMKKQSASKLAFVVQADHEADRFAITFPFNKNTFPMSVPVMYRDLHLDDQPLPDEVNRSITLKWKRRIYAANSIRVQDLIRKPNSSPYVELPLKTWKTITEAVENGNLDDAKSLLMQAKTSNVRPNEIQPTGHKESEHWVDISLQLKHGDTLQVQMTSEAMLRSDVLTVQLLQIKPSFEICVDHVHSPIICFSRFAYEHSRVNYAGTEEYIRIWKPLCEMESAFTAVDESESIIIENLKVNFSQQHDGPLTGSFLLLKEWIKDWSIECNLAKCYLCIRKRGLKMTSDLEHCAPVDPREFTWVAHGVTTNVEENKLESKIIGRTVNFKINHQPMETIPDCVFQKNTRFTVEIIPKLVPDIRKETAVLSLRNACDLVTSIALGNRIPNRVQQRPVLEGQILRKELPGDLPGLNRSQSVAVATALNNTFTLIQGPPGTGKTVVGVYIVYWFAEMNLTNPRKFDDPKDREKKEVIFYCGPSNKSVDVVAEYLMRLKGSLRILRVYSQQIEILDYPYPDSTLQFSPRTLLQDRSKPELRSITLHHRMREDSNPHAAGIKKFDERIRLKETLSEEDEKKYKELLTEARTHELKQHDIILCTCTQSSAPILTRTVSARQVLIDECAMATEPQALIPLVHNKPEQIVLIGDHKQLRPIVRNNAAKRLGMTRSLFERYFDILHGNRAVMLDTQYRMHEDICRFPSEEFYGSKLQTGVKQRSSVLRVKQRVMPVVFGHVKGETACLVVKTAKGNNNSKANQEERDRVVEISKMLVEDAGVDEGSIVVLSPYNAQVSEIKEELKRMKLGKITVTTITKSQGSEWRYVILSTVCSLPSKEIVSEPSGAWLSKHVGFVADPNQINVAITRAKEGLCIIGNQKLLRCTTTWRHLLENYTAQGAVTEARYISVQRPGT